jgi:hypothetical protein
MLLWTISLEPEFDAVVERIISTPAPSQIDRFIFYQLQESEIASSHPSAIGRLLRHLLLGAQRIPFACDNVFNLVKAALDAGADRVDVLDIADAMARLGCTKAQELRGFVDHSD